MLLDIITLFFKGILDGSNLIQPLLIVYQNKTIFSIYKNIIFLYFIYLFVLYLHLSLINLLYSNNTSYGYLILYYIIYIFWDIPIYLITYIYQITYTTEIINEYLQEKNIKIPDYTCYSTFAKYMSIKVHSVLVIQLFTLVTFFFNYIPYLNILFDIFFTSIIFSYYSWTYGMSVARIPHQNRLILIENYWGYFLGFHFNIAILKLYLKHFYIYLIYSILLPLIAIKTIDLLQHPHFLLEKKVNQTTSTFFYIPKNLLKRLNNSINK